MNMIFSADDNWAIGYKGKLLFEAKEDMKHFRDMTSGKTIIMGHNTFKSLPNKKPLPNRTNIILSRKEGLKIPRAKVCSDLNSLFKLIENVNPDDVMVIGGEQISS